MKLKDYLEYMNEMVKNNPKILDLDVVFTNEGDTYGNFVHYKPSIGFFDNFYFDETNNIDRANAVCVN